MNKFGVITRNGYVAAGNLLSGRLLTKEEAINLAAWLVKKAIVLGSTKEEFEKELVK